MGAKRLGLRIEAKRLGGKRLGGETSCYRSLLILNLYFTATQSSETSRNIFCCMLLAASVSIILYKGADHTAGLHICFFIFIQMLLSPKIMPVSVKRADHKNK